jgi:hypothetical protein
MALYKIRHALASWTNLDSTPGMAFRGQVVDIHDEEAKRLMKGNAIIGVDDELEHPGILQDLPVAPTDEELVNWIVAANVSDVKALVEERPEIAPRVEGALNHVKTMRAYEDTHLNEIRNSLQPGGAETDEYGVVLGSGAKSAHDVRDTSAIGNDDITVSVPTTSQSGFTETNTPLATAPVVPPIDLLTLVQGTAQDVANYVSAHPDEAAAVLEAETVSTSGSPRADVVMAVRSATGFATPS